MSNDPTPTPDEGKTYTQEDVNAEVEKIAAKIRSEERRKAAEKYADYDDLKARAGQATTLEERVAEIERQAKGNEARAIRAEIANAKGLTPNQAKRLVGETREELEADADELLADIGAQKKQGPTVPREGATPSTAEGDERETVNALFGG